MWQIQAAAAAAATASQATASHPVGHVDHALISDKLQHAAVRAARVAPVLHLEQHGVVDVQLGCTQKLAQCEQEGEQRSRLKSVGVVNVQLGCDYEVDRKHA